MPISIRVKLRTTFLKFTREMMTPQAYLALSQKFIGGEQIARGRGWFYAQTFYLLVSLASPLSAD